MVTVDCLIPSLSPNSAVNKHIDRALNQVRKRCGRSELSERSYKSAPLSKRGEKSELKQQSNYRDNGFRSIHSYSRIIRSTISISICHGQHRTITPPF